MTVASSVRGRLAPAAFAAASLIATTPVAADNPLLDAWVQCVSDQLNEGCLAKVPVADHQTAVDAACGPARQAYAASRASIIAANKHRSPERAILKANRQVASLDRLFVRQYRECLGEPE